ncbi:MAG TPA: NUDIX hydrolase [Dehalococcoidia bacterium]|nr:NUDIX hydrolase [Dehalococcoidia bacterium]
MKQSGAIFLVNGAGKLLLIHPSGKYNRNAPWMPPKEEIESGETPQEAAQRAVVEELHLPPNSYDSVEELGAITYKSKSKMIWCFQARYRGKDNDISLDWENDLYGWFTPVAAREVIKEEFTPLLALLEGAETC